ncbi:MAG: hypothetical protein ACLSAH_22520 [Bilophila wadsworthia]
MGGWPTRTCDPDRRSSDGFRYIDGFLSASSRCMAAVSGVCAFICAFMPAPTEQSGMLYRIVYELLNWIGCNKGKAKNADDAGNGGK